jgi:hypothetical protein
MWEIGNWVVFLTEVVSWERCNIRPTDVSLGRCVPVRSIPKGGGWLMLCRDRRLLEHGWVSQVLRLAVWGLGAGHIDQGRFVQWIKDTCPTDASPGKTFGDTTSCHLGSCAGILEPSMEARQGCRTGPPGYIGWRNRFLGIDSWAY